MVAFGRKPAKPVLNYNQLSSETSIEEVMEDGAPGEEEHPVVREASCEMAGDLSSIGESFDSIFEDGNENEFFSDDDDDDDNAKDKIEIDLGGIQKAHLERAKTDCANEYSAACIKKPTLERARTEGSDKHRGHANPRRRDLKRSNSNKSLRSVDGSSEHTPKKASGSKHRHHHHHHDTLSTTSSHNRKNKKTTKHSHKDDDNASVDGGRSVTSHRTTDTGGRRPARRKLEKGDSFRSTDTGRRGLRRAKSSDELEATSSGHHRTHHAARRPGRRTLQKAHSFRHATTTTMTSTAATQSADKNTTQAKNKKEGGEELDLSIHTTKTNVTNKSKDSSKAHGRRRRSSSICHGELSAFQERSEELGASVANIDTVSTVLKKGSSHKNSKISTRRNIKAELTGSGRHEFLQFVVA